MITNRDQLIDALANNSTRIVIDKASIANTVAVMMSEHCASVGIPIKDKHEPAHRRQPNQSPVSDMSQP